MDIGLTLEVLAHLRQNLLSLTLEVPPITSRASYPHHTPSEIQPKTTTFEPLGELTIHVLDDIGPCIDSHPWNTVQMEIFERLECPSLTSLVLRSRAVSHPDFTAKQGQPHAVAVTFRDFIHRSSLSTQLRVFVLVGFKMVDRQVLEVIEKIPGVWELKIGEWAGYEMATLAEPTIFTSLFFQRLKRDAIDAAAFLPELKVLRVRYYREFGKEIEELLENLGRSVEVHVVDH
ncbi:hypothetical protein AAF712_010949 [Marasmius tenuissimus]|uniref:Uncharacterized protein n=1 Tax=Marasmius tenuissimus TaxID=585030 RepID=A0ABR2ZKJ7_9AGAR